jgi:hypothetical protein
MYLGLYSPLRNAQSHTSGWAQADLGEFDLAGRGAAGDDPQVAGVDVDGVEEVLDEDASFSVVGLVSHNVDVDAGE